MAAELKKETDDELKYAERILEEYKRYGDADGFVRLLVDRAPDVAKLLGRFAAEGKKVYQIELDELGIKAAKMLERQKILESEYIRVNEVEPERLGRNPLFKVLRIERVHYLVAYHATEAGARLAKEYSGRIGNAQE